MSLIAPNTNNTLPRFKCKKINENNNYYISITNFLLSYYIKY